MDIVSTSDAELNATVVRVWVPYIEPGTITLSLRARVILARLALVGKHPITAVRLRDLFACMISRDAITHALNELAAFKLAQRTSKGWLALEPTGEVRDAFRWQRLASGPWHKRYVYTSITLPETNPWPSRTNALELCCVLAASEELVRLGKRVTNKGLSRRLGLKRDTVKQARETLQELMPETVFVPFLTRENDQPEADDTDATANAAEALRDLGVKHPDAVLLVAKTKGIHSFDLLRKVKKLASRHNAEKFGTDITMYIMKVLLNPKKPGKPTRKSG